MRYKVTELARRYIPLLLIVAIFPFFFTGGPTLETSRLFGAVWDCGHIVFFCLLVFYLNRKVALRGPVAGMTVTIIVFLIGGLIELIQMKVGRDGNWLDIFYDLTGTWIGLVWCQPVTRMIRYARIAVFALTVPALLKIVVLAILELQAAHDFPVIADFESRLELYQYHGTLERTEKFHTHGRYGLKLTLNTDTYSGINFKRSFPDWAAYKQLRFDIYNPDTSPLDMVIRVNDIAHDLGGWNDNDRFNQTIQLYPDWNHLSIPVSSIQYGPADRLMDLSHISSIGIYTARLTAPRMIYIDNLRLE